MTTIGAATLGVTHRSRSVVPPTYVPATTTLPNLHLNIFVMYLYEASIRTGVPPD